MDGGERDGPAAMGLIQRRRPVPGHLGRFGAAHEDGQRHAGDVELNVLPPAIDALVRLAPIPEPRATETGPQTLQVGEPQEEGPDSPCRATGVSGDLKVGAIEVDPAVALGRLRAHRHPQPELFGQPAARVGKVGNLD